MRTIGWVLFLVIGCLGLCSGCGPDRGRQALSGSVTFQGRPLKQGNITFLTTSGVPGPVGGALIRAGRFDIPAAQGLEPGTYRVAISSPVPGGILTPEEKAAGASPKAKDLLPSKYNTESSLTIVVEANRPNQFDFDLQ
jgi:hypothetical protein